MQNNDFFLNMGQILTVQVLDENLCNLEDVRVLVAVLCSKEKNGDLSKCRALVNQPTNKIGQVSFSRFNQSHIMIRVRKAGFLPYENKLDLMSFGESSIRVILKNDINYMV